MQANRVGWPWFAAFGDVTVNVADVVDVQFTEDVDRLAILRYRDGASRILHDPAAVDACRAFFGRQVAASRDGRPDAAGPGPDRR